MNRHWTTNCRPRAFCRCCRRLRLLLILDPENRPGATEALTSRKYQAFVEKVDGSVERGKKAFKYAHSDTDRCSYTGIGVREWAWAYALSPIVNGKTDRSCATINIIGFVKTSHCQIGTSTASSLSLVGLRNITNALERSTRLEVRCFLHGELISYVHIQI